MTTTLSRMSPADVEAFGAEMDAIRAEVLGSLGADDAAYVRRVIALQRRLELAGRATLLASAFPPAWIAGTVALSAAKVLENMEIGHNVLHGQWDWMRDPAIHSTTWEWDNVSAAEGWKHSHNDLHHTWTNVVGRDRDVGYTIMRMSEDQRWHPVHLLQPAFNVVLAAFFQWGIALYDLELDELREGRRTWADIGRNAKRLVKKASGQVLKDYVVHPLLSGPSFIPTLAANATANLVRNLWSNVVIFCGHFPDGAEMFSVDDIEDETRGGWYVRQLLGSANIDGGPLMHLMTGNLSFQIEHHLFPDLPSNRYQEISPRVREICERYDLPYTSGPLHTQYLSTWKRVLRLALPPKVTAAVPSAPVPQRLIAA
ncbi:MAG TPA: acyl-CoA desaturase [Mycobacteriales bacterium]|nr:acyl-CoA desaturase [Mycobacteriales bacterium]